MNIDQVLQPHVCCVGNPVVGNPAQFIMSRAARALGLDWRFFTCQVAKEQFQVAFRGIQALGLRGAAILDPFQTEVIPLLDTVTAAGLALNSVRVARCDGNSWIGDNTLGLAISNCIGSALSKAVSEAPARVALLCPIGLASAIRLADAEWQSRHSSIRYFSSEHSAAPKLIESSVAIENGIGSEKPTLPFQFADLVDDSIESLAKSELPVGFVLLGAEANGITVRQLQTIPFAENASILALEWTGQKLQQTLKDFARERRLRMIDPVEWMAHQAVADFHFWTGAEPSLESIRESLDEYMQW